MELDLKTAHRETFEDYEIFYGFVGENDVWVHFVVLAISGEQIQPEPGGRLYEGDNGDTLEPIEADQFMRGHIKWDGCSDWSFPDSDHYMIHFCGSKQATVIGRLMARMYEIAAEVMPAFEGD